MTDLAKWEHAYDAADKLLDKLFAGFDQIDHGEVKSLIKMWADTMLGTTNRHAMAAAGCLFMAFVMSEGDHNVQRVMLNQWFLRANRMLTEREIEERDKVSKR